MPILVPPAVPVSTPGALAYFPRAFAIGDITMGTGAGLVDAYGVRWLLEKVTGWDSPVGTTNETTQRANDHGSLPNQAFLTQRLIVVEGSFSSDWETANAAIARLAAAVPVSDLVPAFFTGAGPDMQAMVRQGDELLVDTLGAATHFSLSLVAPDPRRYSIDVTTVSTGLPSTTGGLSIGSGLSLPLSVNATTAAGVLSVTNAGNFGTRPLLEVVGPCPPGSVTHLGLSRRLAWPEAVPAGRSLLLDTDKQRALLDGTAARVVTGSWFEYVPGDNEVAFSASSYDPDARLVSTSRSAWR